MAFKPLKNQHFSSTDISFLMSYLVEWTSQFKEVPFLDGRLVSNVAITSSGINIPHNLKRTPKGWFVVSKNANVDIWETSKNSDNLMLDASGDVTASFWIF